MVKNHSTKFIGLDVHKNSITIAIADGGRAGQVRLYGTIENTVDAMGKVIRKLLTTSTDLRFVYEAGPCGFGLYRYLTSNDLSCIVAAPSLIPRKSPSTITPTLLLLGTSKE